MPARASTSAPARSRAPSSNSRATSGSSCSRGRAPPSSSLPLANASPSRRKRCSSRSRACTTSALRHTSCRRFVSAPSSSSRPGSSAPSSASSCRTCASRSPSSIPVRWRTRSLKTGWISDHVRSATIDGIEIEPAGVMRMGVYGREDRFARTAADELPWVAPSDPAEPSPFDAAPSDGWPDASHPRHIRYRSYLMETALELSRQGLAVALLPDAVVRRHNDVVRHEYALTQLDVPIRRRRARGTPSTCCTVAATPRPARTPESSRARSRR